MIPSDVLQAPPREIHDDEPETRSSAQWVTISYPADPPPDQVLRLLESSGSLDFWESPDEDVYSPEDGTPL
jgi:hypothetical protein